MTINRASHDATREQSAAYVLEALTAEERADYEAHLGTCPEFEAEVRALIQVTGALARALPQVDPPPALRDRVLVAWARCGDAPGSELGSEAWHGRLSLPERWQPPRFALGGADVLALGIPVGPRGGELLRAVEAWWVAGDFTADEKTLRAKLEDLAKR